MPMKRSGLLSLWVGGSSVIIWAFNRFQSQALELIQAYPWAVSAYVMLAAGFSFCFCYWFESNLKTPKFQKIICWILQCIGLGLIFISSWLVTINVAIITFLLIREFVLFSKRPSAPSGGAAHSGAGDVTIPNGSPRAKMMTPERKSFFPAQTSTPRSNFFSPLRLFQQRAPLVSVKKYLTQEEYEEQGKRETDLGLASLRDQINSSPEPMKLLKKLHPDTRNKIINFATGSDHIDSDSSDLDLNSQSDEEEDVDSTDGEHTRKAFT